MSSRPDRIVLPATDSWFNQLDELPARELPLPADQAQGLRRLFASHTVRCIPVVSNPSIAFAGAMLERPVHGLCRAGPAHAGGRRRRACPCTARAGPLRPVRGDRGAESPGPLPRRARLAAAPRRCERLHHRVSRHRGRSLARHRRDAGPCAGFRPGAPVCAPRAGVAGDRAAPDRAVRRACRQRDPCLCRDQAAGCTRRPEGARPADQRRPGIPACRAGGRARGALRR